MRYRSLTMGCVLAVASASLASAAEGPVARKPNIVYILADDLGYGDVRCFNAQGKIATPRLDRLAAEGLRFTDAHSGSAVCTPTRYGILTGRYSWRSSLKSGVLYGYSSHLIEPGRQTVPEFLHQQGYRTACVGKWHLGMDWALDEGHRTGKIVTGWEVDYRKPIANGPLTVGFDEYFGISASLDMPPYVFIRDDRTEGIPTVEKTYVRKGPAAADFEAIDVLPALTRAATSFIESNAEAARGGKPFFLYVPLAAPHAPVLPTAEWRGKSGLNDYGDFVMQVDDAVGRIAASLEASGLADDTLLIFTSDNGCSPVANYPELLAKGHDPSAGYRGAKADIFEGGHRVPFIVRWPTKVKPGSVHDQPVCLTDLFATCAEMVGSKPADTAAEDSVSFLPALLAIGDGPHRTSIVHHSINGSFAIRDGSWKLILGPDSGGWSAPKPGSAEAKALPPIQLYDLSKDSAERHNVQADHPEVVSRLTNQIKQLVADGRSTPGTPRRNDGSPIVLFGRDAGAP
ncbi:sulfatase family protein [Paludisphaera soli]|uniref:sulfatase family protein n=1 Tax=Paludisphaera soli TaxID=2712865 RepID=UPI001F0DFA81|nr:arylsulfatase [Paludisphaera soli]